jgi:hypothetical protein
MRPAGRDTVALKRMVLVLGLTGAATSLSGCAEMHHGFQTVARSTTSSAAADEPAAPRARVSARIVTPPPDSDVPVVRMAAVPSPREIFDFHPNGSHPDHWRQPFIIDPNDGPLAADVRKTAEELRVFNAGLRSAGKTVVVQSCSETDVAAQKRGCVAQAPVGEPPSTPAAAGARSVLR